MCKSLPQGPKRQWLQMYDDLFNLFIGSSVPRFNHDTFLGQDSFISRSSFWSLHFRKHWWDRVFGVWGVFQTRAKRYIYIYTYNTTFMPLSDRVLSLFWQGMWLAAWVLNLGTPAAPPSKGSSSLGSMNLTKTQTETNQEWLVWVSNPSNQTRWSSASSVLTLRMWPPYFLSQEVDKNILSTFLDCPCNPPESYGTMQARGPLVSEMLR